jgi:manganese/zinc/iron transport system substrate-binding protein
VVFLLSACQPTDDAQYEGKLRLTCTTSIVGDLVANIAGERGVVKSLMGPGVDPHLYKAKASDVEHLIEADVLFYNGLHLEAKMGDVLEQLATSRHTVAVAGTLPADSLVAAGSHPDPHVWFDLTLWRQAAEVVRDELARADPGGAEYYASRAAEYTAELDALHEWVEARIATVPVENRVLATAHDAFSYFGRRYGLEVASIQGISTASEASTTEVSSLARSMAAERIPAIFVESSIPQRTIQAVVDAARAQGWELTIGGELYSDALGTPGGPDDTLTAVVQHNVNTIVGALDGAPETTSAQGAS